MEYIAFDEVSLLSALGGLMGMFLGWSFMNSADVGQT